MRLKFYYLKNFLPINGLLIKSLQYEMSEWCSMTKALQYAVHVTSITQIFKPRKTTFL